MTGEKCISCNDRFPGCQDHCEYGRAAAAERPKGKQSQNEARDYYAAKRYRR